ncbi:MAG: glycoside hydrolase family 28 protein [Acidobacteriota bacterium]
MRRRNVCAFILALAVALAAALPNRLEAQESRSFVIEPIPPEVLANLPFEMPEVKLPKFPERRFDVREYGAVADGRTMNTGAFSRAIEACAKSGGGMVVVPAGEYLTGPIRLESNVNFHVERGALIIFSPKFEDYPLIPFPNPTSKSLRCTPPIFGYKLENVAVTGSGVFDGSGEAWRPAKKEKFTEREWKAIVKSGGVVSDDGRMWYPSKEAMNGEAYLKALYKGKKQPTAAEVAGAREYLRPKMVELYDCERVLLDGPTFRNSPQFAVHPAQCEHVVVRNVTIQNPENAQNGDGLDLSACHTVVVYRTVVDAGDDAICIKAGNPGKEKKWTASCENIVITDCTVYHGHGGFVIGSETDGGARNILARRLTMLGTDVGLRFKSPRGRGGLVEKIFVDSVVMKDIQNEAVLFDTFYESGSAEKNASSRDASRTKEDVAEGTPQFSGFTISNITCYGAARPLLFLGLPEMPIKNISITHSVFTTDKGALLVDADSIRLDDVKLFPKIGPVYTVNESKRILIARGAAPAALGDVFMEVKGEGAEGIVIEKTDLTSLKTPVTTASGASSAAVTLR